MSVRITSRGQTLRHLPQQMQTLSQKRIVVGCLEGDHAWLAGIHEYGCTIPVTEKMRAFLHAHGVHLKKSTTQIVIPERSFIRAGFDQSQVQMRRLMSVLVPHLAAGDLSTDDFLSQVGMTLANLIKDYAYTLESPPKSGASYQLGSDPGKGLLTDTGSMLDGIAYRVEDK